MSLTSEWRSRVDTWLTELERHLYCPLGEVELDGFTTSEQLGVDDAAGREFRPMPVGSRWGRKWEYGWFRCRVTVPPEADGERFVLFPGLDGETLTYIANRVATGQREPVTLSRCARAGDAYELLMETYAGHGPTPNACGPVPPARHSVPEPPETQQTIRPSTFGIWQEDAYQLALDVRTLLDIRDNADAASLRVAEIDRALREFTLVVDFELPRRQRRESFRRAREALRPALEARNATTTPEMYCFGHGHLDVAWLWPLAQTERKIARTLANQLELFEEYPEHKFLQSQPHLLAMTRRLYPELYKRVKQAVADGKLIADGGMWVEADTNISGGEALIRQLLHGKRFFREEFGLDSELLWLPDAFGYSAALPQILRGCGIKYFSTQKIFWNYHGGETFPYHNFMWQGLDGSQVAVHLHNDYNAHTRPGVLIGRWRDRVQADGMSIRMFPFGKGDGGGGPDRTYLEYLRRLGDCQGCPRTRIASPTAFFAELVARGEHDVNRYVGELYFQAHRGVLTSQAKTKKANRACEIALREAEMWGVAATALVEFDWPVDRAEHAWTTVLLNQFHDILPGSSIARVYAEAEAQYADALHAARDIAAGATDALTDRSDARTVFNSLSWPRDELVELPDDWAAAADDDGRALPVQTVEGRPCARVRVASCGWATIRPTEAPAEAAGGVTASPAKLESDLLRVELNERGELVSVYDKSAGREVLAAPSNVLRLYKDVPTKFDAWDIDSNYKLLPVDLGDARAEIEVVAAGPLLGRLRLRRRVNDSTLTQEITLRADSRRIDFATSVDWRECHKLLKVDFSPDIHAEEAVHEIQFGHVRRPNHASRPYDADRFEVCNHRWTALAEAGRGAAVLNDCKYGVSTEDNTISLSLLRAPKAPDENADVGTQEFTYAFYAWTGPLAGSGVVRAACELNAPATVAEGASGRRSLLSVDAEDVVVEAVKPAADGSGDVIVRLYESMHAAARCTLTTSMPVREVRWTDMLESGVAPGEPTDGRIELSFRPFEIKTLRFTAGKR
ncbi:MAG: alpha-mannosidase [Planctomycetota bacterium]